jgi:hypothetical protein
VVLLFVKDALPLKSFIAKMKRYYPPLTYKKALLWVELGWVPIWPRMGRERINVRTSRLGKLFRFLRFDEATIAAISQDLNS